MTMAIMKNHHNENNRTHFSLMKTSLMKVSPTYPVLPYFILQSDRKCHGVEPYTKQVYSMKQRKANLERRR